MTLLKKRTDIIIKKADKGNAFVALTIPHVKQWTTFNQVKAHMTRTQKWKQ